MRSKKKNYVNEATKGPNGVGNAFLATLRGKRIIVANCQTPGRTWRFSGTLVAWDHYHLLIEARGELVLLTKQPGWSVRESKEGDTDE